MLCARLNGMTMHIVISFTSVWGNWRRSSRGLMSVVLRGASTLHQRRGIRGRSVCCASPFRRFVFRPANGDRVLSVWSNRVFPVAPPTRRRPRIRRSYARGYRIRPAAGAARAFDFFTSRRDHWFRRRPRRKSAVLIRAQVGRGLLFAERPALPWTVEQFFFFFIYILVNSQIHTAVTGSEFNPWRERSICINVTLIRIRKG